jgi:DNA-binding transcriptional regulator YhcF (GntR family)
MLFRPNPSSGVPIYLQLMEQVKHAIETGALRPGDQLPGIRPLAEELVINPNTLTDKLRAAQTLVAAAVERLHTRGVTDEEIRRLFEAELARLSRTGGHRG